MLTWMAGIKGMRSLPPQALLGSLRTKWTGVILATTRFTVNNNCRESSNCCDALAKNTDLKDLVSFGDLFAVTIT